MDSAPFPHWVTILLAVPAIIGVAIAWLNYRKKPAKPDTAVVSPSRGGDGHGPGGGGGGIAGSGGGGGGPYSGGGGGGGAVELPDGTIVSPGWGGEGGGSETGGRGGQPGKVFK